MSKTVIFGAGPIGLYLAIRLVKAGLNNLVIYDPRAGEYTRPGHLNDSVFEKLKAVFGEDFQLLPQGTTIHIKNMERKLYALAIKMGIVIEKKRFVGFNNHELKELLIKDEESNEHVIQCDYAFDCTGSQRRLINAVNEYYPEEPPFTINTIFKNSLVKTYFLAYVKMDLDNYNVFKQYYDNPPEFSLVENITLIDKLQEFGWKEYSFPDCYEGCFGKDKYCFYMECPDNLPVNRYEAWVNFVFECLTKQPIRFEYLPEPKYERKKPRFHSFVVDPKALSPVSCQRDNLPMIIAQGDAQIEAHPQLANGVEHGLERVDALFNHLVITEGNIGEFNAEQYSAELEPLLLAHKNLLIQYYQDCIKLTIQEFPLLIDDYKQVLSLTDRNKYEYRNKLSTHIRILEIRQAYYQSLSKLRIIEELVLNGTIHSFDVELLPQFQDIAAAARLPASYNTEKREAKALLIRFMNYEIKWGQSYFQEEKYDEAAFAFQGARELFNLISISRNRGLTQDPSYSLLLVKLIQFIDQQLSYVNSKVLLYQKKIITDLLRTTPLTTDSISSVIHEVARAIFSAYEKKPVQKNSFFPPSLPIESIEINLKRNYQQFVAFVERHFDKEVVRLFEEAIMLTVSGSYGF